MQEVYFAVFHLIITLGVLGGYLYTAHLGTPDETLKGLLYVIGGYWFGAMGANKVLNKVKNQGGNGNE